MSSKSNEKSIKQRALPLLLRALDVREKGEPISSEKVGGNALRLPDRAILLILPERAVQAPISDTVAFALEHSVDIVLLHNEDVNSCLSCDVILAALPGESMVLHGMEIWLHEGELWLVGCHSRCSIKVSSEGLELVLGQPAATPGQWLSGLLRAQQSLLQKQVCEEVVR